MKFLIVNADDVGLSRGQTAGALRAHADGVVTSASVITATENWEHTCAALTHHPDVDLGIHLTLCEGAGVLPVEQIPSLVDDAGRFPVSLRTVVTRVLRGSAPADQIQAEWRAQIGRAVDAGLTVTHLDSHKHLHMLPALFDILCAVRAEFDIPFVRIPYEPGRGRRRGIRLLLNALARPARRRAGATQARVVDRVAGIGVSGGLALRPLIDRVRALPDGVTELITHPGVEGDEIEALSRVGLTWMAQYQFAAELAALTSDAVRSVIEEEDIHLTTFGALAGPSPSAPPRPRTPQR